MDDVNTQPRLGRFVTQPVVIRYLYNQLHAFVPKVIGAKLSSVIRTCSDHASMTDRCAGLPGRIGRALDKRS